MSIFNSDDSAHGYEDGIFDAENGKDKNYLGMISAKFFIYGEAAANSYSTAYDQGYMHGMAKKNNVFFPLGNTKSTGDCMIHKNNFTIANADAIADFIDDLSLFNKRLSAVTKDMENYIIAMQNGTWDDNNYIEFRRLFARITHRAYGIEHSVIEQSMVPILQAYVEAVRKAQMAGGR